jgi:hypothetical protein
MSTAAACTLEAPPVGTLGERLLTGVLAGAISGTLVVSFGVVLTVAGVRVIEAGHRGWLVGPFTGGTLWPPMPLWIG